MAKGTRFLIAKTKHLFRSVTGLDRKQITFHPTLPLHQRTFHEHRLMEDYESPKFDFNPLYNYERNHQERWAFWLFFVVFGISDFVTRVAYDEGFSHRYYISWPEEMYILDQCLNKYRTLRDKYFNYLGETHLTDYDYNAKKEEALDVITNKKERELKRVEEGKVKQEALQLADKYVTTLERMVEGKKE